MLWCRRPVAIAMTGKNTMFFWVCTRGGGGMMNGAVHDSSQGQREVRSAPSTTRAF